MTAMNRRTTSDQTTTSSDKEKSKAPLHLSSSTSSMNNRSTLTLTTTTQRRAKFTCCLLGLTLSLSLPGTNAIVISRPSTLTSTSTSTSTSQSSNALALLNTARLMREQRSSPNHATASSSRTSETETEAETETETAFQKQVRIRTILPQNASWQTLFDDDDDDIYNMESTLEEQDAFISSRVKAHLPSVKSLRTLLGSEIPDMELHLQMEAARVRALANGGAATAALVFMDLHHEMAAFVGISANAGGASASTAGISAVEQVAMSSLPSQLPELATSALSREISAGRTRPAAKKRTVAAVPIKTRVIPVKETHGGDGNGDGNGDDANENQNNMSTPSQHPHAVKKIKSKHVSTIMSARKALGETAKEKKDTHDASPTARVSHDEEIQLATTIQRGVELHNIKSKFEEEHGRDITRQEWTELAKLDGPKQLRRMVSDYRTAKNKLVMANMGLVHAVVRSRLGINGSSSKAPKTNNSGITYEELVQEGSLGLLRASELFDPSRGLRFSTYATIWIKGVLCNSNISNTIALPQREKTKWNKIQTAAADLKLEKGAKDASYRPTEDEIATRSGMGIEEVKEVISKMKRAKNVLSLDYQYETQGRSGTDNTRYEALNNDKNLMDDVDLVERLHVRADVIAALARNLDPREAKLMRLRYGLNDGHSRSIKDCAESMGISQSRAQQLAIGCLKKLREADDAESLQEYLLSVA